MTKVIAEFRLAAMSAKMEIDDEEIAITVTALEGENIVAKSVFADGNYVREATEVFEYSVRDIFSRTSRSMLIDHIQRG